MSIPEAKYAYNGEATAAGEDNPALRPHLKEVSKSNLNVATRKNHQAVTTTDYGFIDMPPLPSQDTRGERDAKGGHGLGDKSRITADEDMIAGEICLPISTYNWI